MSTSMFTPAKKSQAKARVALDGPTGAGKSWTGLIWATTLAKRGNGRVAAADTERGSLSLYAPDFDFDVLRINPPYEPERLVKAIKAAEAEGYDVMMIDSLTHFWEGEGGTLEIVDAAAERARGNSYAGWKVGTPALRRLVDTMLGCDMHLVVTMRSKMEYILEEDRNGKKVPKRVGMAPVMRAGIEYEFTMVGELDLEHRMIINKSRCPILADRMIQKDAATDAAEEFAGWLDDGEPMASVGEIDDVRARIKALGKEGIRAWNEARQDHGLPETTRLSQSQVGIAHALIDAVERDVAGSAPPAPAEEAPPDPNALTAADVEAADRAAVHAEGDAIDRAEGAYDDGEPDGFTRTDEDSSVESNVDQPFEASDETSSLESANEQPELAPPDPEPVAKTAVDAGDLAALKLMIGRLTPTDRAEMKTWATQHDLNANKWAEDCKLVTAEVSTVLGSEEYRTQDPGAEEDPF